jgi:hypothetical protein
VKRHWVKKQLSKRNKTVMKSLTFLIALLFNATAAHSVTLLFETFNSVTSATFTLPVPGGFQTVTQGAVGTFDFTGSNGHRWQVGNAIDFVNGAYGAPNNSMAIDLNASQPGRLLSDFVYYADARASTFTLEYDYWGNGGAGRTGIVEVLGDGTALDGTTNGTFLLFASIASGLAPNHAVWKWDRKGGSNLIIDFFGYNNGAQGVTIDNILVTQELIAPPTAVPLPSGSLLLALGLGLLGSVRRVQAITRI